MPTLSPSKSLNSPDGVLLIGHGTRDVDGTREFFELAGLLSDRLAPFPVEGCLLEFQSPTIPEAWRSLVGQGVKHVRVTPLLLFAAGHAKDDIPELIGQCAESTPGVTHAQTRALSRAPEIVDLLSARVSEVAKTADVTLDDAVAVVFVGRGSYDPCAQADMRILAEIVARRLNTRHHAVGFYAMAEPKLPEVLDHVAASPKVRTVIVQPHLLFQGRLYAAIDRQVGEANDRHSGVDFILGDYLGPVAAVADAIAHRIFPAAAEPRNSV